MADPAGDDFTRILKRIDSLDYLRDRLGAGLDEAGLLENLAGDLQGIFRAAAVAVFLVDPRTMDFSLAYLQPRDLRAQVRAEFDRQADAGTVAWVINHQRPAFFGPLVLPSAQGQGLVLAPLTTGAETLGLVLVHTAERQEEVVSGKLVFQSLVTRLHSFSLANLRLRQALESINLHLEEEVARRSRELAGAHRELRAQHEKLQAAYDELKSLDRAKDDFVSLVSHELRTPLTSMLSYVEILHDGLYDTPEQLKEFLGTVLSETRRLINLVNDILDLSKIEAGKLAYQHLPLAIEGPIRTALAAVRARAAERRHELASELDPAGHWVQGDAKRLTQVLANLLSNAIKFTPPGGRISVEVADVDDKVRVAVTDTGIGIRPEDMHQVFSKFGQIEKTEYHTEGTGLGMPISKAIVEAHHGTMWVESVPGQGSRFYFTLPRLVSPPPEGRA